MASNDLESDIAAFIPAQQARARALLIARAVLESRGPLAGTALGADRTVDKLLDIAEWILDVRAGPLDFEVLEVSGAAVAGAFDGPLPSEAPAAPAPDVYAELRAERDRAHAKHGENSMESWPADDPSGDRRGIVGEEYGEVCREFNDARIEGRPVDMVRLRAELIQLASTAVAWADAIPTGRPSTPERKNPDGSTTMTIKRACNGCHRELGDATEAELAAAIDGRPLPDVRVECGCAVKDARE